MKNSPGLIVLLMFAGCTASTEQILAECEYDVYKLFQAYPTRDPVSNAIVDPVTEEVNRRSMISSCMEARGYAFEKEKAEMDSKRSNASYGEMRRSPKYYKPR
jgi:hypothetical protein